MAQVLPVRLLGLSYLYRPCPTTANRTKRLSASGMFDLSFKSASVVDGLRINYGIMGGNNREKHAGRTIREGYINDQWRLCVICMNARWL